MKITPDHLARGAFIYIRQSTVDQLANNHESRLHSSRKHASASRGTSVTLIASARSSVIQIGNCASVPSGWRMVRATSSPWRLRPVTMTVSPQRG